MHKKTVLPDIRELVKEIERWAAENSSGKERIGYMRREIEKLGGKTKKYFTPFKHRLIVREKLNEKKKDKQEEMANYGIKTKKRKNR